jgi:cytochrome P450
VGETTRGQGAEPSLPPGPPLPSLVQTPLLFAWPRRFLSACRRRYGDAFTLRIAPMGDIVYLADPEHVRAVFTGDSEVFHAGEGNQVLGHVLGERSVLLLDGEEHMRERRLMLPPFHGESVRAYEDVIAQIAREELDRWPVGSAFPLHPRMRAIALEAILRAVIGARDPRRLDELRRALPPLADIPGHVMLMWIRPELARIGPWRRFQDRVRAADEILYDEIRSRRADPALSERRDVLSLLLQARRDDGAAMSDRELRDELVTLLMAGHETTATGLSWAFERLLRSPAVLRRLEAELAAGGDEYLEAVVKEVLRSRPVIWDVVRRLTRPAEVAGRLLPRGAFVAPAIILLHSSGRLHDAPDEFRPERFLGGGPDPYTWIPFGGGVRRCLGASFAVLEMKTVLRVVLTGARLRAADPAPERARARHITLVPARGARVVLEERLPAETDAPGARPALSAA